MPFPRSSPFLALASLAFLSGCGSSSSDDEGFGVLTAPHSASSTAEIAVSGVWMVYLASEPFTGAGTDLNGDTDALDEVAVAVNMAAATATELRAAKRAVLLGDEVFLVVSEAQDGVDWNAVNGMTDTVLLHWTGTTFDVVDTLDALGAQRPFATQGRLYYRSSAVPAAGDESSLRYVTEAAPATPVQVAGELGLGLTDPEILREEDGLLFLALDETGGTDKNGDGDALDTHVLAVLDATDAAALVLDVEVALADANAPIDAVLRAADDWLVAVLVAEAPLNANGQSRTNGLNDQGLFINPLVPCATNDTDATDQVLHYFTVIGSTAVASAAVNTGIAGDARVLAFTGFVATVSPEADANCDLNADGDTLDDIARWVSTTTLPVAPVVSASLMHALETSVPGGSFGLSVLDDRLVAVVDEADDEEDLDGRPATFFDLVGWIQPSLGSPVWHFAHQHPTTKSFGTGVFDDDGDSEPFAGTSWMAAEATGDRLGMTFLEEVPGVNPDVDPLNTNLDCNLVAKDNDKIDALPVWVDFESGPTLDFDGVGYSVVKANPGIVLAAGHAFFRVSEQEDNRDYNGDSVLDDVVLFRNPLTSCGPVAMSTSSALIGPVIATDNVNGAAFLSVEGAALVVKYFRF